ncbi:MAG: SPOR domain-containing protein, partial [Candidatus Omnitrophica bacterium]|nr:SPOR domain-containing protein [Candidatus Omnitrophota bacterium]
RSAAGFISRIRNYEKVVLGVMVFIIFGVVTFCIGVERGKSLSRLDNFKRLDVASKPVLPVKSQETVISVAPANVIAVEQPLIKKIPAVAPAIKEPAGSYTVQVGSYKNNSAAQKEAQRLRQNGLDSLVLVKGAYSIVCIGSFTGKNKAQAALLKLKNQYQYHDCLLRRL